MAKLEKPLHLLGFFIKREFKSKHNWLRVLAIMSPMYTNMENWYGKSDGNSNARMLECHIAEAIYRMEACMYCGSAQIRSPFGGSSAFIRSLSPLFFMVIRDKLYWNVDRQWHNQLTRKCCDKQRRTKWASTEGNNDWNCDFATHFEIICHWDIYTQAHKLLPHTKTEEHFMHTRSTQKYAAVTWQISTRTEL